MKQLIDLFNKKYGKEYYCFDDTLTNEQIYKIVKLIAKICSDDDEMMSKIKYIKLPKPQTNDEIIEYIELLSMKPKEYSIAITDNDYAPFNITNTSTTIKEGESYSNTFTVTGEGFDKITIKMNDVDITNEVVTEKALRKITILIPEVTGNIDIYIVVAPV